MALVKSDIDKIMTRITQKLSISAPDSLRKVLLYGSYARGNFTEDSDIDIMVLVDDPNPYSIYPIIFPDVNMLEDEYPVMISCRFQNYEHFYDAMNLTSFYKNVEHEGVVYYDSAT